MKKGKEVIFKLKVTNPATYDLDAWSGATPDAKNELKAYLEVEADTTVIAKLMPLSDNLELKQLKLGSFHTLTKDELLDAQDDEGFSYELPSTANSLDIKVKCTPKDATITQIPQGAITLSETEQLVTIELSKGSEKKVYRLKLKKQATVTNSELEWLKVDDYALQSEDIEAAKTETGFTVIAKPHVNPVITWASKATKVAIKTKKANESAYTAEVDRTGNKRFTVVMPEENEERPVSVQVISSNGTNTTTYNINLTLETSSEGEENQFGIKEIKLGRIYTLSKFDIETASSTGFSYQLPSTKDSVTIRTKYFPPEAILTQTPDGAITLQEQEQTIQLVLKKGKTEKTYTLKLKKGTPKEDHELKSIRTNNLYLRDGELKAAKDEYHLYRVEVPKWKKVDFVWESDADSVKVQHAQIKGYKDTPQYGEEIDKTSEKKFTLTLPAKKEKYFAVKITTSKGGKTAVYTIIVETIKEIDPSEN